MALANCSSLPLTTPVVEIAGDGKTAKGMWNVQGSDNDITAQGPISNWSIGYLCIDFIREGDSWKIWHLMYVEDIRCPMGESWVHPREIEAEPGFEPLGSIRMPGLHGEGLLLCGLHARSSLYAAAGSSGAL